MDSHNAAMREQATRERMESRARMEYRKEVERQQQVGSTAKIKRRVAVTDAQPQTPDGPRRLPNGASSPVETPTTRPETQALTSSPQPSRSPQAHSREVFAAGAKMAQTSPLAGGRRTGLHVNGRANSSFSTMSHKASNIYAPWSNWESLSLILTGVPPDVNTFTLWKSFRAYGSVEWVELFENSARKREGRGKIRFRPPPKESICHDGKHRLELTDGQSVLLGVHIEQQKPPILVTSPIQPDVKYPSSIDIPGKLLDLGSAIDGRTLLSLRTVGSAHQETIRFTADLCRREINVFFHLVKFDKFDPRAIAGQAQRLIHEYRLRVPFAQLTRIFRIVDTEKLSFVISLESPALYQRKLLDLTATFSDTENIWKSADAWFRQTDIVHAQQDLAHVPVSLRKSNTVINIGRWTTFRLIFDNTTEHIRGKLETLCNIFKDFNVEFQDNVDFAVTEPSAMVNTVWRWIDPPTNQPFKTPSSLEHLTEEEYTHLPFTVRYQLEVCISHGYLNEYTMGKDFATRLADLAEQKAKDLLEYIATEKKVYYDPMKIFDLPFAKGATNGRIPKYCCYMRSARITPSTIYFNTPSVDISNRVIRHYIEYADRFLRVRFTDERYEGRINPTHNNSMDEVFTRIKRAMTNGITIGDRRYDFLAFGNSQFREHGAYFFASLPNLTAASIRAWMGHFSEIKIIAKYAARLGQCFSTTRAVTGCPVQIREIGDIERNGFTFSDGVGRISKFLAQMVMTEFKLRTPSGNPPSVFQFRLGGCKGILTMSPEAQWHEVHIRKSQYKFAAEHNGLEIIRSSQFSMASLNRQLIAVLSSLGVPDGVFKEKLRAMLENLDLAMTSETRAIHLLQKYIDPNAMTLLLADMVQDGFQKTNEPFVKSLLELWRAWQIKYLKEKAKIVVEKGACLFGCVDETAKLKGYFEDRRPQSDATYEESLDCLPEVFVQVSHADQGGKYEIIEGPCIVARNPSLHTGDIRVVKAVNVPELHHLRDVVVFAQTGDRDVPSMCSGGDLDGDDYLVIWDQDFLPNNWFRDPMDHSASNAPSLSRNVTVNDVTSFFVTYMKNDRLPQIAHAHLAFADYLEDGVNDERCIKLANLHSAAVDYNKTGIPAKMTKDLIPRKWPHFMEKKHKPKDAQYVSKKILGQLYDIVERVDFRPKLKEAFDARILDSGIEVSDELLTTATEMKAVYDADMRRIMAQHEIKTEFEVWSTFVLSHANMSKDYKFHEELGQISTALRERHLNICYEKAGGKDFKVVAPLAVAMYKVTCDQMTEALARLKPSDDGLKLVRDDKNLPLISFPWILQSVLGKIANKYYDDAGMMSHSSRMDINAKEHSYEKKRKQGHRGGAIVGGEVETAEGIQKAGEVLELFHDDNPSFDPFSGLGEAFDRPATAGEEAATAIEKKSTLGSNSKKSEGSGFLIDFDDEISLPLSDNTKDSKKQQSPSDRSFDLLDISDFAEDLDGCDNSPPKPLKYENKENTPPAEAGNTIPPVEITTEKKPGASVHEESPGEDIEMEGDIKPSAIDRLEKLLGF